ncbi:MAG: cardiolipin synthase B [Alphaproteobacteria bacterium]|nr:cardiolipin synthase B [Alphaproteobacteria bacterium]
MRALAAQAFSRAAGAPLIDGNRVRILEDARENYPAWLEAIRSAKRRIHFEAYFIRDDETGRSFAEALAAKARDGVAVRLVYDWFGNLGKASSRFWEHLRGAGVDVRCYNPPQLDSPLAWVSRDHRKMLEVDGEVAFITGLCVASYWAGDPARGIEPWRDTGVEIRGPAIAEIVRSFARTWASTGSPLPDGEVDLEAPAVGDVCLRIVASEPATTGMLRLDQMVAALARKRLWLTDAYYAGTSSYVQALRAAAKDGVDVRLMVPNATDIPLLRPLSRTGYRPLLEAGVRVFEWNGTMLHAKTATMDGQWARVGSTNLNIASWFGNLELDAVIEDQAFATAMEEMYERDLANATEVVLDEKRRMRAPGEPHHPRIAATGGGSASRAAAGAMRFGRTIGAALMDRRVLEPIEARLALVMGATLSALALLFAIFPRALAYPLIGLGAWAGLALLYRGYRLYLDRKRR